MNIQNIATVQQLGDRIIHLKHIVLTIMHISRLKYNGWTEKPFSNDSLRGEKLNYKSVAKEISKPPFLWLLKSSGQQSLLCLFDSRFLEVFRTTPIFGMSRDHNRKNSDWVDHFQNMTIRFAKRQRYLHFVVCVWGNVQYFENYRSSEFELVRRGLNPEAPVWGKKHMK